MTAEELREIAKDLRCDVRGDLVPSSDRQSEAERLAAKVIADPQLGGYSDGWGSETALVLARALVALRAQAEQLQAARRPPANRQPTEPVTKEDWKRSYHDMADLAGWHQQRANEAQKREAALREALREAADEPLAQPDLEKRERWRALSEQSESDDG